MQPPTGSANTLTAVDYCKHDLPAGQCAPCRNELTPIVYVSDGGAAYHLRRDCQALASGQEKVGTPSPVRSVRLRKAEQALHRRPCLACCPRN